MDNHRFSVVAGGVCFRPPLPLNGALNLARDLVSFSVERAYVVDQDNVVRFVAERNYDN